MPRRGVACLAAGRKRFELFSPADAQNLYVVGPLTRIHPNGRMNYGCVACRRQPVPVVMRACPGGAHKRAPDSPLRNYVHVLVLCCAERIGTLRAFVLRAAFCMPHSACYTPRAAHVGAMPRPEPTHADGRSLTMDASSRLDAELVAAEAAVAACQAEVAAGKPGAKKRLAAAEARVDAALEAQLDFEAGDDLDGSGLDDDGDDFDDEDEGGGALNFGGADSDDGSASVGSGGRGGTGGGGEAGSSSGGAKPKLTAAAVPWNFSQVDLAQAAADPAGTRARFPLFAAAKCVVAEVDQGECLYLPAGVVTPGFARCVGLRWCVRGVCTRAGSTLPAPV